MAAVEPSRQTTAIAPATTGADFLILISIALATAVSMAINVSRLILFFLDSWAGLSSWPQLLILISAKSGDGFVPLRNRA
jgi:hypothetical protein